MRLKDKLAVITGGSHGIGAGVTVDLASDQSARATGAIFAADGGLTVG